MRPETVIQRAIRTQFKALGFETVHVPNGSVLAGDKVRRARQMNSLKSDGLMPGFPDLIAFAAKGRIAFIEVKQEGTYQSKTQKDCQAWLESLGHRYTVMRSSEDVKESLIAWGWIGECDEQDG